ncbi:RHS repeat-associated core domain-containing protein [Fluviicola taffensis]|uniref:RHS repeat domain-containing protein n=1 Tax=Fluviicola taffensis TaxID=191579 RepID=UPI003137BBFB
MKTQQRQALVRKLQGTMSVYERVINSGGSSVSYTQTEKHIYGSSRLGVHTERIELLGTLNDTYSMVNIHHHLGNKTYELTNHLGNVLSVISDKVIPHNNGGTIDYWLADLRQSTDYSPFGVMLHNRDLRLTDPATSNLVARGRYGFNGMEMDNEIHSGTTGNAAGDSYDFGARMYDPRLGRFLSIDNYQTKFPEMSPYSYAVNSPIILSDKNGDYPVALHYIITYNIMIKLGYSVELSKKVAHLSSVYADHPDWKIFSGAMLLLNREMMSKAGLDPDEMYYKENIDYSSTKDAQSDEKIESVSIHGMRTYWENISTVEAVKRALWGGEFLDDAGNVVVIEGAYKVINRLMQTPVEQLTEGQLKELGVALHTIQDAQVHKGTRWLDKENEDHVEDAEKDGHQYEHPDMDCTMGKHVDRAIRKTIKQFKKFAEMKETKSYVLSNEERNKVKDKRRYRAKF